MAITTTALPSSRLLRPRQGPGSSPLPSPILPDTCNDIFGTSGANAFTRNLFVAGDGWLQGFVSPITGSLCSLSFAVKALQLNPANATVAVYAPDATKDQIVAGAVKPVTTATSSTTDNRLIFSFCGPAAIPLTEDLTYNFAVTFAAAGFPNVPLTLAFQNSVNSTGSFFGPSFTPIFTVVNEGIVFNLTTSATSVPCGDEVFSSSSSLVEVETSTAVVATTVVASTTTTTTTSVDESTSTAIPAETTLTTAAVESTIPIIETTTAVEIPTTTTAVVEPTTVTAIEPTSTTTKDEVTSTSTSPVIIPSSTADFTIISTISILPVTTIISTEEPPTTSAIMSTSTIGPATLSTLPETETETTSTASPTETQTPPPAPSCTATADPTTTCESCRATAWMSCANAKAYTTCLNSPTLKLCYRLACAPHQDTDAYLKQCEQLEIWARYTHDDEIPEKW
ncbi:hypothetical protein HDU86_002758 [Geranomyces michiganensis]|nr:hypothetical protein HDU86_002758 [Geranomyces michiganensis]